MKISEWFETRTRDNGESFVTLKDDAPDWLREAVRDAHCGSFPDDWIFEIAREAAIAIDDGAFDEESTHEFADSHVEIYTRDLFQWAADHCLSSVYSYAEEEAEGMSGDAATIEQRFQSIQYCAIHTIGETIFNAYRAHVGEE